MAKSAKKNISTDNKVSSNKNNIFLVTTIVFFAIILFLSAIIGFVVVPSINSKLRKMGIDGVNEFIVLSKELNNYVSEDDLIKNRFSTINYQTAQEELSNAGVNIFTTSGDNTILDPNKFSSIDAVQYQDNGAIELSDKELGALLNNALTNTESIKFFEDMGINIFDQYQLGVRLHELSLKENTSDPTNESIILSSVGRVSLSTITNDIPWPFNGVLPETIYISTSAIIDYSDGINIKDAKIQINNLSEKSHNIAINIINAQLQDSNREAFTLSGFSQYLNEMFYQKIELFAQHIHSSISIDKNAQEQLVFVLNYVA